MLPSNLRRQLQQITDTAASGSVTPNRLEQIIAELASVHRHTIRRLIDEVPGYRCFVHAFELLGSQAYILIADADFGGGMKVFFAGSAFARYLIETALVEIAEDEALSGDIVIYLDDDSTPRHAGKIASADKRIKSKWGGGLFLEHGLWEVPGSYGNTVRFYRAIPADSAEQAFLEFAKSRDGFREFVAEWHLADLFE